MSLTRGQAGFGAIAAIVVLVILALLAAAIVSVSTTQQLGAAQDVLAARVWQAARAGNEWGLYKALKDKACATVSGTTLTADAGVYVTVSCSASTYNEGETVPGTPNPLTVYRIEAVACPVATGCPVLDASVAGVGYVERRRVVVATDQ